jgi:adenosylcobinamide-phosphate synthase
VRLAGDAYYSGQLVKKEFIGDPIREISPGDIIRACKLMYFTVLLLLALLALFTPVFLRWIKI